MSGQLKTPVAWSGEAGQLVDLLTMQQSWILEWWIEDLVDLLIAR